MSRSNFDPDSAVAHATENSREYLDGFLEFLKIPSGSAISEHAEDIQRAAEFVAVELRRLGFSDVEIMRLILAFTAGEDQPVEESVILDFIEWIHADNLRAHATKTVTVGVLIATMVLDDKGYGVRRGVGTPYEIVTLSPYDTVSIREVID